jgi:hypothetical protein
MHPVQRARDTWKAANPGKNDWDFARVVGYANPDAIYKQMRGEYVAPHSKLATMAAILGWTPGRFLNECAKAIPQRRTA